MIGLDIVTLVSGLFCLYEAFSYVGVIKTPYITLLSNQNIYFMMIKLGLMKWTLILGIFGVLFGFLGLILFRKNDEYIKYRTFVSAFYFIICILMFF